jgi:transcriptional regulator with XRE-family HTH domain
MDERKLSQADAAKVLGVTQPKVSALRRFKLQGFSVERLMNLLTALDQDVEIVIRRKPRSRKAVGLASSRRSVRIHGGDLVPVLVDSVKPVHDYR